jgi:RNA-binding protein 16
MEYKIPGLYVIDSIVRQSRHQFGADKDVFAPRFAKNLYSTFTHLFQCPPEDKVCAAVMSCFLYSLMINVIFQSKIIRVLNLWQKNQVFTADIIQPIFDLADPNKRPEPTANGGIVKASPQKAHDGTPKWPETAGSTPKVMNTPGGDQQQSLVQQLQTLQQIFILQQQQQNQSDAQQVYFLK